jgi:hypothetical protein
VLAVLPVLGMVSMLATFTNVVGEFLSARILPFCTVYSLPRGPCVCACLCVSPDGCLMDA